MKHNSIKTVVSAVLSMSVLLAASAQAHEGFRYRDHDCCRRGGFDWVAPAIIGGVIGYELSQPQPRTVIVEEPAVVYTAPPVVYSQPPLGYHWQLMMNPQTGQQQMVLVPN